MAQSYNVTASVSRDSGAFHSDKTLNAAVVAASVASVGVVAGFATSTIFGVTSVATLAALASHK